MPRAFTVAMQNALRATEVKICWLVKLEFTSGDVYLTSLYKDISWSAQTWLGNGWLRSIDGLSNVNDHSAVDVTVNIGGIDSNAISLALGSTSQTKKAYIYLGLLDSNDALIADPYLIFTGYFDDANIDDAIDDTQVGFVYRSELANIERINVFRFTHLSQQALFPGDKGFEYVSQAAEWSGYWGTATIPKTNQKRKRNTAK